MKPINNQVVPIRITSAREFCIMSMPELAEQIGVTRQAVSKYEMGSIKPSMEVLMEISKITGFPIKYFFKPVDILNSENSEILLFRGPRSKNQKNIKSYRRVAEFVNEIIEFYSKYVSLFDVNIPDNIEFAYDDFDAEQKIESIAAELREFWNIGKSPINDIVGLLENNGFILSILPYKNQKIDAYSLYRKGRPYIFFSGKRTSAVSYNFSLCHELGHLLLHRDMTEEELGDKEIYNKLEYQANLFAGAFLLPAETFSREYITSNLNSFISIKKRWRASLGAMIFRAAHLNIISENNKEYLFKQLNGKGYKLKEPYDDEIIFKKPSLLYNILMLLLDNKIISFDEFLNVSLLPNRLLSSICCLPSDFEEKYMNVPRIVPTIRKVM